MNCGFALGVAFISPFLGVIYRVLTLDNSEFQDYSSGYIVLIIISDCVLMILGVMLILKMHHYLADNEIKEYL